MPRSRPHHGPAPLTGCTRVLAVVGTAAGLLTAPTPSPARAERGAAHIHIQVRPFGRCSVRGAAARTAPFRRRVPAGTHEIICRSGQVALAALVRAPHGAVRDLTFDLTRAPGKVTGEGVVRTYPPAASLPLGTLTVRTANPAEHARCALEGGRLRQTPWETSLLPGAVSVVCQLGPKTLHAQVRVRRGESHQATFDFAAERVRLERRADRDKGGPSSPPPAPKPKGTTP